MAVTPMDDFDEMVERLAKANGKVKELTEEVETLQATVDENVRELEKANSDINDYATFVKQLRTMLDNLEVQ